MMAFSLRPSSDKHSKYKSRQESNLSSINLKDKLFKSKNKIKNLKNALTGDNLNTGSSRKEPRPLGSRLGKKLYLINHRTKSHDMSMWWALAGVVLMMIDAECYMDKTYYWSQIIRSVITITTLISLGFLLQFQFDERRIFKEDNSLQSWHTVLLSRTTIYFLLEIVLLCLHPAPFEALPGKLKMEIPHYPYEFLAVIMFIRLYLPVRSLILHSQYFNSSRVQMLGALNNMNTGTLCNENVSFIVRHQMATHAGTIIGSSLIVVWQIFAWILYTSEKYYYESKKRELHMQDDVDRVNSEGYVPPDPPSDTIKVYTHGESIYLIPITMMSIGYGDYYPCSNIARTICCIAGVCGLICTAILIAVLSRKLQMTRRERYLHKAMIEAKFHSDVEHKAACVLQTAWKSYKRAKKATIRKDYQSSFSNKFSRSFKKPFNSINRKLSVTNEDHYHYVSNSKYSNMNNNNNIENSGHNGNKKSVPKIHKKSLFQTAKQRQTLSVGF